jgi:hypothetical protein
MIDWPIHGLLVTVKAIKSMFEKRSGVVCDVLTVIEGHVDEDTLLLMVGFGKF